MIILGPLSGHPGQGSGQSPIGSLWGTRNWGTSHTEGATQERLLAAILGRSLHPVPSPTPEEMQKDTSLCHLGPWPPTLPWGQAGRQAHLDSPSKSETRRRTSPNPHRKPSISKVILGFVADKGAGHPRVPGRPEEGCCHQGLQHDPQRLGASASAQGLVDKGMLKQVTGKGATGSFLMGKNHASKFKLKAKRRQRRQRRPGQCQSGQRRLLRAPNRGTERPIKGVRRAAKCRRS